MNSIPSLGVLAGFVVASTILALTPGPDMAFFLGRTLQGGRRLGFIALSGTLTGLLCHVLLAAFGLSRLLAASAVAFEILRLIGCAYLLWLAVQTLRHGSALSASMRRELDGHSALRAYLGGAAVNLFNPKVVLFFLTFLPQFVDPNDPHAVGKMVFLGLSFIVIAALVCSIIILCAAKFTSTFTGNRRAMRIVDYGFAGVMGLFAGKLLLSANR